jgi:hypothetical protein
MKKTFILASLVIALSSCSKSDIPTVTPQVITPTTTTVAKPITFTITPQKHDGGFANFQAGEIIGYDVAITDPDTPTGATYELTPVGVSQSQHQIIDTDYVFDKTVTNTSQTSASKITLDTSTGNFQIKILRPGTFYLKFSLQKIVAGKKIGDPVINEQVIFSAVKFYLYVNWGYDNGHWDRDFYFNVDCGDPLTDIYFSDPSYTYSYSTNYCAAGGYSGTLGLSGNPFSPSRREGSGTGMYDKGLHTISCNGHNGMVVDEIIITQKSKNNTINNVIRYKNIPINDQFKTL